MARPVVSPLGRLIPPENQQPGFEFEELPVEVVECFDCTGGMISALPRKVTPLEAFLVAKNARVTSKGIRRRDGTVEYLTKPDSDPVLLIAGSVDSGEVAKLVRITASAIHYSSEGTAFIEYTNNAPTILNGTVLRPQVAAYLDDLYVCGWTELLRIVDATKEVVEIASGPGQFKHIVSWADRIIVGHKDDSPFTIAWSANADPTDWTSSSSGEENLIQAPSDLGDSITGLFALEDELVILRKESIWIGQRQPFGSNPFRFSPIVNGLGCDLPYTAVRVPGGIMFADRRTNGIYFHQRGAAPVRISDGVGAILDELQNAGWAQATFDAGTLSYVLGLVTTSGSQIMEKFWIYNILEKAWTYDDSPASQSLGMFAFGEGIAIDSLTGTIDAISGTIDDLTAFDVSTRQYRGLETGEVIYFDSAEDTDYDDSAFELELQSINLGSESRRRTLSDLVVKVSYTRAGSVTLQQSKDASTWVNTKVVALSSRGKVSAKKNLVTGDNIYWRLKATTSDVLVKTWWARLHEKGLQQ